MKQKNLLQILFSLTLLLISSCASITLPDTELCGIKGQLQHGMMCSTTVSKKERELSFDQAIDFLHATESHGPALCQSSEDWTKLKNTIEAACVLLGKRCKKKLKKNIKELSETLERVQSLIDNK